MTFAPLVCWLVVNSVPYHDARARAAADAGDLRICMAQLTDVDAFRVLQQPKESQSFRRVTLFPNTPLAEIRGRAMARRVWSCFDELKPDVVCLNGWSFGGAIAALGWSLSRRVPTIIMSESTEIDDRRQWWLEAVKRRIVALCSAALVGGTPHLEYMVVLGSAAEQVFTGYDAVDNGYFSSGAAAARRQDEQLRAALGLPVRYFLACARFSSKKNLLRLMEAFAIYRGLHGAEAWSLVIVGDGELRLELMSARDRLGLADHAFLPGAKPYRELPAYYGLAGAFVHASTTEQWGLVVNEAMASGLPVLVSKRCGCAGDLVKEGCNGFLFDPYDTCSMAAALHRIATRGQALDEMGRRSREIIARWSPENFAKNLARAATAALSATPPKPSILDRTLVSVLSTR
ncbi:glycosyltransferase family 4 protein [Dongia deserti]|uniref:glycosyltransferase family 4 protein n=1 Tax=Dongia deserti TaxID=2268030 RepID=UPI0013C459E0|nr:glycosyltransferase family 4 protein [Dongia deserti]